MTTDPKLEAQAPATSATVRFSLAQLFYVITILGAALSTMQWLAMVFALGTLFIWTLVFASANKPPSLYWLPACLILAATCVSGSFFLSGMNELTLRQRCRNNLQKIALAVSAYEENNRVYPPAYIADAEGRPMHSWRVLILPYLNERKLYAEYDFSEPWNGPHNAHLAPRMPDVFRCLGHDRNGAPDETNYFAVVGPETIWPGPNGVRVGNIEGGVANKFLLVEKTESGIQWLEPRDLNTSEVATLLSGADVHDRGTHHDDDFFYEYRDQGRFVAFADGHTAYLADRLAPHVVQQLIARTGNLTCNHDEVFPGPAVRLATYPRYGNWFRLAFLLIVAVLPLPWVWIHPRGTVRRTAAQTAE